MIELDNITRSFGSLQVLKGISLNIERGEVVSITGPSGAGKTTLLQIMGSLDKPDGGKVLYGCLTAKAGMNRIRLSLLWVCKPALQDVKCPLPGAGAPGASFNSGE